MSIEEADESKAEIKLVNTEEIQIETKTSFWNVFKWSMYDLANTIYSMVIVSLIINQYVLIIGQSELGLSYARADLIYNVVFAIMQILVAIGMPIMGALSDRAGRRKPFVIVLTGVILISASLLGLVHSITYVLIFFVIANMAYQWSLAFYDAMLAFIANPKDSGKVGGFGVAFGYFGTLIGMAVMLVLQDVFKWGTPVSKIVEEGDVLSYGYYGNPWTFVIAMALFFVCAIPFVFVNERQKKEKLPPIRQLLKETFGQVGQTFRDIRKHKEMFKFIIGYFLVVDVANIIVAKMFLIVRDGLLMPSSFSMIFIIISTVSAVIFTYFVGMFATKFGAKNGFWLVGGLWGAAMIIGVLGILFAAPIDTETMNFAFIMIIIMGVLAGPALGGTWVAQRVMITELAPKEKYGEYFGFSKLSGKVSAAIGPLIWSAVFLLHEFASKKHFENTSQVFAEWKAYGFAMLVVGIVMIIGLVIIGTVKPNKQLIQEGIEKEEKVEAES
ncbi:MAG: MFS transporter [Candidatus Heimdallarchaeota archaeon]